VPLGPLSQEEKLERKLSEVGLLTKDLVSREDAIVVLLSTGEKVFFSPKGDFSTQVTSLQFILSRTKIEGRRPKSIDLRFEKPVLEY